MAIVLSFQVIALIMFQSQVLGHAMLLIHLFKQSWAAAAKIVAPPSLFDEKSSGAAATAT